jgi:hypothetical protein
MRTLIGWISALFASGLIGAAMYGAVLSDPVAQADTDAVVERMVAEPGPQPTLVRTEVREVVEPTPTVTVDEVVLVAPAQPAAPQRATTPGTTRTAAPSIAGRGDSSEDRDDHDSEDSDRDDERDDSDDAEDDRDDSDDAEDPDDEHEDD